MTIDHRLNRLNDMQRELDAALERIERTGGGSGGGGADMIDRRVNKLEDQFDRLRDDNSQIRAQLAGIKERLNHMPTRFEFFSVILGAIGIISAVVLLSERITG